MKILVAVDIAVNRQQLIQIVLDLGHEAIEADSGEDALRLIDTLQPDVLLLDLLLAGKNGFEVACSIRDRITDMWLPVIMLSSLTSDESYAHALAYGVTDCILKPVDTAILDAKLLQYQRILSMQSRLSLMAQRQHAIHEHIATPVITIDEDGRVSELNRAARLLFSLDVNQVQPGGSVIQLIGLDIAYLLKHDEVEIRTQADVVKNFSVAHNHWDMNNKRFWTIALHDTSNARRVDRMKNEFLATVNHELRTPLTSILGALGLMAAGAGGALPKSALELTHIAKRNGERLSRLIDDVLDLTKLEANRMTFNLRPTYLGPLIREAVNANGGYAQRCDVTLHFEDTQLECQAEIDPDRFLQIMANLISNAIKHSPKGKAVRVNLMQKHVQLHVTVVDEGPGIDPTFRKNLFEKFSQADGSDPSGIGGTGLGLYISRILTEKMGGTIFAESGAVGGATFGITLPRLTQSNETPWILCIAKDHQLLERLADWLSDIGRVDLVNNLAGAEAMVRLMGTPSVLLANPQAQGPVDAFCTHLLSLQMPGRIVLMSDAFDAGFASRHGMGWFSSTATPRHKVIKQLRAMLADNKK